MADSTIKQKVLDSIESLPGDATIDDILERIWFIHKVEVGIKQSIEEKLIDHEEVLKKFK